MRECMHALIVGGHIDRWQGGARRQASSQAPPSRDRASIHGIGWIAASQSLALAGDAEWPLPVGET